MSESASAHMVGLDELEQHLPELLDHLAKEGEELVITRNGEPAAVILDIERYREVQQALREFSDPEYLAALLEARREVDEGGGVPAEEVFAKKAL
ncbi:MAG TPA: type II toxin-antitoxin system Phd/YefM family antitoxin [Chloroflexota bacterium]|nr:type II toxin-antitoxin system Phd/YefM family antitoxin [Chloroflexota bacterium]